MDEVQFWRLAEQARATGGIDCDEHHDTLLDRLKALPPEDIIVFDRIFGVLLRRAYRRDLKEAYGTMTGSGSDDGFTDFRSWLIGQGRAVYEKALANPDSLVEVDLLGDEDAKCEQLTYAALHAYEEKTGQEMPDHARMPITTLGQKLTDEELLRAMPKLCQKYGCYSEED